MRFLLLLFAVPYSSAWSAGSLPDVIPQADRSVRTSWVYCPARRAESLSDVQNDGSVKTDWVYYPVRREDPLSDVIPQENRSSVGTGRAYQFITWGTLSNSVKSKLIEIKLLKKNKWPSWLRSFLKK